MVTKRLVCVIISLAICSVAFCETENQYAEHFNELNTVDIYRNILEIELEQLSNECKEQISEITHLINRTKLEAPFWFLQMVDATSKLQSGLLQGNLYNLGSFDECLSIESTNTKIPIKGQYCLGTMNIHNILPILGEQPLSIFWALCLPDKCNSKDLLILTEVQGKKPVFDFSNPVCQTFESTRVHLDAGDISYITFLAIIALLLISSSLYDLHYIMIKEEAKIPVLKSFSVISNGKKLLSTNRSSDQLECMSGMRAISMMWIVLAHLFTLTPLGAVSNLDFVVAFFQNGWTMYIRGATVSVDTFLMMSGIVMIYVYMKSSIKINLFYYYLHRYLRLTPALAAVIFFHMTILKHFGSGPLWHTHAAIGVQSCQKYWWSALLYVQNFVNPSEICVGQSWYLSVDTQLFILSPLILIPLKKWKKLTLSLVALASSASMSCSFALAWIYETRDSNVLQLNGLLDSDYMSKIYNQTYTRASPWLFGCIIGYFIYEYKIVKKSFRINRFLNLFLWAVALAVMLTCVFVDKSQEEYNKMEYSFYIAFVRPAWSLAIGWIIFSCVMGYGGVVNSFLSLPIFQVLGRLTYTMYLTHLTFEIILALSTKESRIFTIMTKNFEFWSTYIVVVVISIIWTLAFESPIINLEKLLLKRSKPENLNKPHTSNLESNICYDNSAFETTSEKRRNELLNRYKKV